MREMMNEKIEMKEHAAKYDKEERKSEMRDESKPALPRKKKMGDGGLINVTLEGSGRACYPKLKKLNDKPY